jgi:preprotein translocase subunit SecG
LTTLIVTIHIIACVSLIALVLLQSGKEGMGVIFGGGSQSVFGSTGAGGLLVKLSAIFGAIFLITSLAYNYYTGVERRPVAKSIMLDVSMEEKQAPPAGVTTTDEKTGDKAQDQAAAKSDDKGGVTFEEKTSPPEATGGEAAKAPADEAAPAVEKKENAPQ